MGVAVTKQCQDFKKTQVLPVQLAKHTLQGFLRLIVYMKLYSNITTIAKQQQNKVLSDTHEHFEACGFFFFF